MNRLMLGLWPWAEVTSNLYITLGRKQGEQCTFTACVLKFGMTPLRVLKAGSFLLCCNWLMDIAMAAWWPWCMVRWVTGILPVTFGRTQKEKCLPFMDFMLQFYTTPCQVGGLGRGDYHLPQHTWQSQVFDDFVTREFQISESGNGKRPGPSCLKAS